MYTVIVEEANTRGDPIMEVKETDTLKEALSIVETFSKQYLPEPDSQFIIKLMPTSIF